MLACLYCTLFVRNMLKEKRLEIRLAAEDFARLEAYAKQKDVSMAQILRESLKRLPKPVV